MSSIPDFCTNGKDCEKLIRESKKFPIDKTLWRNTVGAQIYQKTIDWRKSRPPQGSKWTSLAEHNASKIAQTKWGTEAFGWLISRDSDTSSDRDKRNSQGYTYSWFYDLIIAAAQQNRHSPEFLHAVAMGEGMNGISKDKNNPNVKIYHAITKNQIKSGNLRADQVSDRASTTLEQHNWYHSFNDCGLDRFAKNKNDLVKNGYLSKIFTTSAYCSDIIEPPGKETKNERGEPVNPSWLYGLNTAIFCISAELQNRRNLVLHEYESLTKKSAALLSQDAIDYLTYIRYNAGEEFTKNEAIPNFKEKYFKKLTVNLDGNDQKAKHNAIRKLATADFLRILELYKNHGMSNFSKTISASK